MTHEATTRVTTDNDAPAVPETQQVLSATLGLVLAQTLGAFNDNFFKIVVSLFAVSASGASGGGALSAISAIFILPFLLFSGYAGHVSDAYSKRAVLVTTKVLEILTMAVGLFALVFGQFWLMLVVLFLLALEATFFSPAKYGILPELVAVRSLSRANGLLEMGSFLAIILGTSLGSILFAIWKDRLGWIGALTIVLALLGTLASLRIPVVPAARAHHALQLSPFAEIALGLRRLRGDRTLWTTVIGISYFWFLGALMQMNILLFGKEIMGLDDLRVGLLSAFIAIGIGTGSFAAGRLSGEKIELGLVPLGAIGMGVFSLILAYAASSYVVVAVTLAALGFSGGLFIVPLNASLQQKSGHEEKGRLLATNNFLNTIGILLASGVLWLFRDILQIHADTIALIFGVLTLGVTVYLLRTLPDFFVRLRLWLCCDLRLVRLWQRR